MFKKIAIQNSTLSSKFFLILGLIWAGVSFGCGGGGNSSQPQPPTITVSLPKAALTVGKTIQASVTIGNFQDQSVIWSVDGDPTVASISATGLVLAGNKAGMCTIRAQSRSMSSLLGTTTLTVVPAPIIFNFSTERTVLYGTAQIDLVATFTGGIAQIEGIPGTLQVSGVVTVLVDSSRQFKLTVTNAAEDYVSASISIVVVTSQYPVINDLIIDPILNWSNNTFTTTATFSGGDGAINGTPVISGVPRIIPMPSSGIFRLVVENNGLKEVLERRAGLLTPGLNLLTGFINGPGNIDGEARSARFGWDWSDGTRQMHALAADEAGNIYIADGNPAIRILTTDGQVETYAGSLTESGSEDGPRATARFTTPWALAMDDQGNLWCTDFSGLRVVRRNGQVETVTHNIAPTGTNGGSEYLYWDKNTNSLMYSVNQNGSTLKIIARYFIATGRIEVFCSDPRLTAPRGIARTTQGTYLVTDFGNNSVFEIDDSGKVTLAYQGICDSSQNAYFCGPYAIVADRNGEIFLNTESGNNIYHLVKINNRWQAFWMTGLTGLSSTGYADGSPRRAAMGHPRGMAFRGDKLVIADAYNHVLREMDPFGNLTTIAGEAKPDTGWAPWGSRSLIDAVVVSHQDKILAVTREGLERIGDDGLRELLIPDSGDIYHLPKDGPLGQGQWGGYYPALAFDPAGNLYIAVAFGSSNLLFRKMDPSGNISTIGQYPFENPFQICVAPNGDLVFANLDCVIRRIKPDGKAEIIAGNPDLFTGRGYQDGPTAQAKFLAPVGAAVDADGTIYVSDWGNHVVRKISTGGIVSTLAGSPGIAGQLDGTGIGAKFDLMHNIYLDNNGDLLVLGNNCIRKVTKTGTVSTLVGSFQTLGVKLGPLPGSVGPLSSIGLLQNGDMVLCARDYFLLYLKN